MRNAGRHAMCITASQFTTDVEVTIARTEARE
jgi:hypothetical protein